MIVTTIRAGTSTPVKLDPSDKRRVPFDWDRDTLPDGVGITTSSWTITVIKQNGATVLTKDNEDILSASEATDVLLRTVTEDNRVTILRLLATTATEGDEYLLSNLIVTDETPVQEHEQSCRVLIQTR